MTRKGFERLSEEFNQTKSERRVVVKGVTIAAEEGDRSENAEYIYGKKKLREIDKRLAYLASLLKDVSLVAPEALRGTLVCFGCTVLVEDEEGKKHAYTLVGEGEADLKYGSISVNSPVAKALLRKAVGDVVEIHRPKGPIEYEVVGLYFGDRHIAGAKK